MKKLIFIFLIISSTLSAQQLRLKKAWTVKINRAGTSHFSSRCFIDFTKDKNFKWSLDSLVAVSTGKKISYDLVRIDNPEAVSPDYTAVKFFSKKDKGYYRINFIPANAGTSGSDIDKGVVVYYSAKNKRKQLKIDSFGNPEIRETP